MKALVYTGPREFSVQQVPTPEPGPGHVRIRTLAAGVCGTDRHIHDGGFGARFPLTPGHEVVGVVDALGEGVTGLRPGQQVSVNPNLPCGCCAYCRAGRPILCPDMLALGVQLPGFFAEYATAPASLVFDAEGLPLDTAVMCEPTACAMHGVETLSPRPGCSALVIGAGPTGVLLSQLIARSGAASVTVADLHPFKLETATTLGLDATVLLTRGDTAGNTARLLAAAPDDDGYDVVVEATGTSEVASMCVPLTRRGGTVLVYGVNHEDARVQIAPFDIFRREITVKGSFAEVTSFGAAIQALRGGRVRTDGIITHRFGLDDWEAALAAMADPSAHKVVLTF